MKAFMVAGLFCFCWANSAGAQEDRWVTFKTGRNDWGRIEHQLDVRSIQTDGTYKVFWARI